VEGDPVRDRGAADVGVLLILVVEQDAGVTGTICLARLTGKFSSELMATMDSSRWASLPRMIRLSMWWVWSNMTAESRQAPTSSRQLVNSGATTG
jgi:hypothetical protein